MAQGFHRPTVDASTIDRFPHCAPAHRRNSSDGVVRRLRVLTVAARIAAGISGGFGLLQFCFNPQVWWIGVADFVAAGVFAVIPLLRRYNPFVAPLVFTGTAYTFIIAICWLFGTASGLQFYLLAAASLAVLIVGIDHIGIAATVAGIGAGFAVALQFLAPADTGLQPAWLQRLGFSLVVSTACFMTVATVWYALRQISRAEAGIQAEYERSEALLTNILPASVAERLKDPAVRVIADSYRDAAVLFADIADFTRRASETDPYELVEFLNQLYSDLDRLVDRHGLEKIKTSGDSYMVVGGVPDARSDHLAAVARFALDLSAAVTGLRDPLGAPISLRIGLACGPVVAGVVGTRRFFYDVWGDAVNLAARMESTGTRDRIQVPDDVYERLRDRFAFEERGAVEVKGKGMMHTWYLVGEQSIHVRADSACARLAP